MEEPIRLELPTFFAMKTVNSYLFIGDKPTLIDCGEKTEETWLALESELSKYNLQIRDIKRLVITHAHVDHMGMANKVSEHSGAKVWVSDYVFDWAVNFREMWDRRTALMLSFLEARLGTAEASGLVLKNMAGMFNKIHQVWDAIPAERLERFSVGQMLELGGAQWEVHYFPGHSITQTCFYQPNNQYLLSADMLLNRTPTPVIDVQPDNPSERVKSLSQMLDSYARISKMHIAKVFPGHYEPFEDAQGLIKDQVRRIHNRKLQCLELIKSGYTSFIGLYEKMYKGSWNLATLAMLIGYLDILMDEGYIKPIEKDGYLQYFPIEEKIENRI